MGAVKAAYYRREVSDSRELLRHCLSSIASGIFIKVVECRARARAALPHIRELRRTARGGHRHLLEPKT